MAGQWELLEAFVNVARAGSFTAAAKMAAVSQPTLSRAIAELEERLGVQLFVRHSRGLELTDRGAELLAGAREVEDRVQDVLRRATGLREKPSGIVRVSAGEPIGVAVLCPAFAELRTTYPDVALELVVDNGPSNLSRREADIAVRMFRPTQLDLVAKRLGAVELAPFASREYVALRGTPRSLADLGNHTFIGLDRDPSWVRTLARLGLDNAAFAFRTDHIMAHIEAVRAGVGIGVLHVLMGLSDPGLVRMDVPLPFEPLECWLVVHQDVRGNPAVRVVYEALERQLDAYLTGAYCPGR